MRKLETLTKDENAEIRTQNLIDNFSNNKSFIEIIMKDYFLRDVKKLSKKEFKNQLINSASYLEWYLEEEEK